MDAPIADEALLSMIEERVAGGDHDEKARATIERRLASIRKRNAASNRHHEIARLNALGWTDSKIADHLKLSRPSVCIYRRRYGIPPVPAGKRVR